MNGSPDFRKNQSFVQNVNPHTGTRQEKGKRMELIKIENREGKDTVNARDLHEFLEVKTRFNDWISNRIKTYDFRLGPDFTTVTKNLVTGGTCLEHYISIDMAKELSMVERNEKGKQARQYFIECEKRAKQVPALSEMEMIVKIAQANVEQQKQLEAANNRLDLLEAKTKTSEVSYFTIIGYCSLHRVQATAKQAADLGRKCAKLSREKGIEISTIPDPRFGRVNTYHVDILQEIVC